MSVSTDREKWNQRYAEQVSSRPEGHPLGRQWRHRFVGGAMLDAASGLGRGIATAEGRFHPVYAVDLSEVALRRAKACWSGVKGIHWIQADVGSLAWPENFLGLVCAFGFTDLPFFRRLPRVVVPGGMFVYEGFSARQLTVKPTLNSDWTSTVEGMQNIFAGWDVICCKESVAAPYRLRFAAIRPR